MSKKLWNEPDMNAVNLEDTAATYLRGTVPDGDRAEENCEPGDYTYQS